MAHLSLAPGAAEDIGSATAVLAEGEGRLANTNAAMAAGVG